MRPRIHFDGEPSLVAQMKRLWMEDGARQEGRMIDVLFSGVTLILLVTVVAYLLSALLGDVLDSMGFRG